MEGSTGSGTITRSVVGYRAADTLPLLRAWKRHRLIGAPRLEGIDYFLFIAASKMTGEKGGEMELSRGPGGQKEEEEEIKGKDPLSSLSALPPSLPPFLRLFFCFQPGLIRSNFRLARWSLRRIIPRFESIIDDSRTQPCLPRETRNCERNQRWGEDIGSKSLSFR